eukprot:2190746-Prymnesium_polylepis.1
MRDARSHVARRQEAEEEVDVQPRPICTPLLRDRTLVMDPCLPPRLLRGGRKGTLRVLHLRDRPVPPHGAPCAALERAQGVLAAEASRELLGVRAF